MDDAHMQCWLADLTWKESREAFKKADTIVLPCGSTEQHSIHLPLAVDTIRAKYLTEELLNQASEYDLNLLALPPLPFGYAEHHMNYSGTITLSYETYIDLIVEIGESVLRHGGTDFVILNCHGGNREPHKLALDRLQRDHNLRAYYIHWTDFARHKLQDRFGSDWGHAGEYETSQIELFRPELVRSKNKEPQNNSNSFQSHPYAFFEEITEQGGLGDPTQSDPEFMSELVDTTTREILKSIREDYDIINENALNQG